MSNTSIKAAFERMWLHVVTALGGKSDTTHTHSLDDIGAVGRDVSGTVYTIDGTEVTAGTGAEIFNNYNKNVATGNNSHAEGSRTTASGAQSHSEGLSTTASGAYSHAEGWHTTASSGASHTEGSNTTASGDYSHAEGSFSVASGVASHAEGENTLASSDYQHVQGKNNIEDAAGTYAHIVGNGESSTTRSNAHTLDWEGNAWYAGAVNVEDKATTRANLGTNFQLLWTNPSPTSRMSGWSPIELDLSEYSAILIWYRLDTTSSMGVHGTAIVPVGPGSGTDADSAVDVTTILYHNSGALVRRYCYATTTQVVFSNGAYRSTLSGNWTTDSSNCVPERIYGIR